MGASSCSGHHGQPRASGGARACTGAERGTVGLGPWVLLKKTPGSLPHPPPTVTHAQDNVPGDGFLPRCVPDNASHFPAPGATRTALPGPHPWESSAGMGIAINIYFFLSRALLPAAPEDGGGQGHRRTGWPWGHWRCVDGNIPWTGHGAAASHRHLRPQGSISYGVRAPSHHTMGQWTLRSTSCISSW